MLQGRPWCVGRTVPALSLSPLGLARGDPEHVEGSKGRRLVFAAAVVASVLVATPAIEPVDAARPLADQVVIRRDTFGVPHILAETAEGGSGQALAGSVIAGYQFGARWAVQGEYGWMGDVYCQDVVSHGSTVPDTHCHRDPIFSIDAVMRFKAGGLRPYLAFGLGMGVHVGTGLDIPVGRHVVIAPGVDINMLPDMLVARPKVSVLVRF